MKKILLLALLFVSTFAHAQNIKNDGEPYEVKDSIKVFFDVDEHFTLNTHVIN
jgi:hypothetical protein